jgi:hypothetical protein
MCVRARLDCNKKLQNFFVVFTLSYFLNTKISWYFKIFTYFLNDVLQNPWRRFAEPWLENNALRYHSLLEAHTYNFIVRMF